MAGGGVRLTPWLSQEQLWIGDPGLETGLQSAGESQDVRAPAQLSRRVNKRRVVSKGSAHARVLRDVVVAW
jgi:hypothetical protein